MIAPGEVEEGKAAPRQLPMSNWLGLEKLAGGGPTSQSPSIGIQQVPAQRKASGRVSGAHGSSLAGTELCGDECQWILSKELSLRKGTFPCH